MLIKTLDINHDFISQLDWYDFMNIIMSKVWRI